MKLPSDPISISRVTMDRYCPQCGFVTPWWATLRQFSTFLSINCCCLTCGSFRGKIFVNDRDG